MNIRNRFLIALLALILPVMGLSACSGGDSSSLSSDSGTSTTAVPPAETTYYLGASWCGYAADNADNAMKKLDGYDDIYFLEVTLNDENADPTYGGHFYKVTNGTWDANGCWGSDHNQVKAAPVHPDGAGLGSVYIDRNGTFTVYFNAATKQLFDTSAVPRVYGDFNAAMGRGSDWAIENDALLLLDLDFDGKFEGTYTIPAYAGDGDGYMMAVCVTIQSYEYDGVTSWGASEQYLFNGAEGGMGKVSHYKPEKNTKVTFSYDPATHVTTLTEQDA